jgi:hypothetical protein
LAEISVFQGALLRYCKVWGCKRGKRLTGKLKKIDTILHSFLRGCLFFIVIKGRLSKVKEKTNEVGHQGVGEGYDLSIQMLQDINLKFFLLKLSSFPKNLTFKRVEIVNPLSFFINKFENSPLG